MTGSRFRNGKVNFFYSKVVREYDGKLMKLTDEVKDIFGVILGKIDKFTDDGEYIKAKINCTIYDIDELYYQ